MTIKRISTLIVASTLLSACMGGGGSGDTDMTPVPDTDFVDGTVNTGADFDNTVSVSESSLRFVAITNAGVLSNLNTGALDHDTGTITGGVLGGTLNGVRDEIDLTSGGTVTLENDNADATEYLRIFRTEGAPTDRFGVVGIETGTGNLPTTGATNYRGNVEMQASNVTDSYALTGQADITADWGGAAPSVRTTFTNLSGTGQTTGAIADAGTLTIQGALFDGNGFTGGGVFGSGTVFDGLPASASLDGTRGEFFGPDADEVGGVIVINGGGFSISGVYSADNN